MKGRKPTPSAIKNLRGTTRKKGAAADEPQFSEAIPEAPDFLEGEALQIFYRHCRILSDARVLTDGDRDILARLSWVTAELNENIKAMRGSDRIQTSQRGGATIAAGMRLIRDLMAQERALMAEVGLSPTARNRLKTVKGIQKDSLSKSEQLALGLFQGVKFDKDNDK